MPLHRNQSILLNIDSISNDGNGVGRYEGQVVFVPCAAQGDTLQVKVVKPAKTHAYAIIEQVVTPGPGRRKADCPIAGKCGGCSFRHLNYEAELEAKRGFVADALKRIGKLDIPVLPTLPSPEEDRYRNKVQYPVAKGMDNALAYGFYAARSHRIIPCVDCLLQPEILNEIAAKTAEILQECSVRPYDEATHTGNVRHIYLRQSTACNEILLCLVCTGSHLPGKEVFVQKITALFPQITTIIQNINPHVTNVICGNQSKIIYGKGTIKDSLCGVPMLLDEHTFAQVNPGAAEVLFAKARQLAAPTPGDVVLDLYCGTGVIGLSMAAQCKRLIGVDVVPQSIESAKRNATEMGLKNTSFYCEDAAAAAARLAAEGIRPDVVIIDPPRKGAGSETLRAITDMAPERIVMVSCNPATLARDLAQMVEAGYTAANVQPADMFPRTKHVECVVLMTRMK